MKRDIRINKGISLFSSEWAGLDSLARQYGLSRNGLLAAIAKGEILLSQSLEAPPSKRPQPTLEYLLTLANGSLPQNLARALRIWAIAWSMPELGLKGKPSLARWRRAFFSHTHPSDDAIPELHDSNCRCALTAAQWLRLAGVDEDEWRDSIGRLAIEDEQLDQLLDARLFAVTRRSLATDLEIYLQRCY